MSSPLRRALRGALALPALALLSLALLAPGKSLAAPLARPAQQGVNASGIITNGQGTCFPDAVLVDCNGAVVRQLKGPGGAAFFSPYIGQWVDLNGAETACAGGGTYLNVVSLRAAANPCPGSGQQQPTATPVPGATATPAATAVPGAGGNLALGRAVKASSSQAGFPPEAAIDGNAATWWASNAGRDPRYPARNPQWIYVDLGSPQQIESLKIRWRTQRHARTYELYVWRDECRGWCFGGGTNVGDGGEDVWTAARRFETQYVMLNLLNPYLMGQAYEIEEWEILGPGAAGAAAANSAKGKAVTALSTDPAFPAANATDGDLATEWRSSGGAPTWVYVDLGADTTFNQVILRWAAGLHATQYTLYGWNGRAWSAFHTQRAGTGGDETASVWTMRSRYILLYANAGAGASIGLREFEVYDTSSGGGGAPGLPTPPAPPPPPVPLLLEGRADLSSQQPFSLSRPLVLPAGREGDGGR